MAASADHVLSNLLFIWVIVQLKQGWRWFVLVFFFGVGSGNQSAMTRSRLLSSGFCQNNGFLLVLIRGGSEKVVRLIVTEGFSTQTCKFERGGSEVVVWKWCWLAAIATTKKPLEPIRFNLIGAESLPFYIMVTSVIKCKKKSKNKK